jgi:ribosomal protein S12 methylthiotransferase
MSKKIGMISLGCPKNTVDSEVMMNYLDESGFIFTDKYEEADAIIINTCSFIDPAKEESIEAILDAAKYKRNNKSKSVVVAGCLVNRYRDDLKKYIPEIDAMVDTFNLKNIVEVVNECLQIKADESAVIDKVAQFPERKLITPNHFAYLKIADGCNHNCSFCTIPMIKGPQVSRSTSSLLKEAEYLAKLGVKELIVISQDTLKWGNDLNPKESIVSFLKELDGLKLFPWIRIMYLYPYQMIDEFLDIIADSNTILPYFDIPFQHSHPDILKTMKRGGSGDSHLQLIEKIRSKVPNAILRTSLIVGFPGEDEKTIENLKEFLSEAKIENVGIFSYWHEYGTEASKELKDKIKQSQKNRWRSELMKHQQRISNKILRKYVGKNLKVIVDAMHPESEYILTGRFYGQAPDVDGMVMITEGTASYGDFVEVYVKEAFDYDLNAKVI